MNSVGNMVKVGIADMDVVTSPQLIRTVGLGSCVGVVVYDSRIETAALAHVMLPDSSLVKGRLANPAKFADTAIRGLVERLKQRGSTGTGLKAKMSGGAQMFKLASLNEITRIGPRNIEEIERQLMYFRIDLVAADVGGNSGRTIDFDPESETLYIHTVYKGMKEI